MEFKPHSNSTQQSSSPKQVKFVQYNLDLNGHGGKGKNEDGIIPLISALKAINGDIVVLNEVARGCFESEDEDKSEVEIIAEQLGMGYVFGVEFLHLRESD